MVVFRRLPERTPAAPDGSEELILVEADGAVVAAILGPDAQPLFAPQHNPSAPLKAPR